MATPIVTACAPAQNHFSPIIPLSDRPARAFCRVVGRTAPANLRVPMMSCGMVSVVLSGSKASIIGMRSGVLG
ncbi:MAG: hypothetical protein QM752_00100 [Gammaproteobacteria bacterium]